MLGFALGGTSALCAGTADAVVYKRMFASVCQPANGTTTAYQATDKFFGMFNGSSSELDVICPVVDNTSMPNTAAGKLTKIQVYGQDTNASSGPAFAIAVKVCARAKDSAGLTCGTGRDSHAGTSATFTGNTIITMSTASHLSALGTDGQFLYLWITLPRLTAGAAAETGSFLRAIYFEKP